MMQKSMLMRRGMTVLLFVCLFDFLDYTKALRHDPLPPIGGKIKNMGIALNNDKSTVSDRFSCLGISRGGSTSTGDDQSEDEDEYDDYSDNEEGSDNEYDEEDEDQYDEDQYGEAEQHDDKSELGKSSLSDEFDEPFFLSPATQLYTTFGCMMLSRRIDLFNPVMVRVIRAAFIAQILIQQLFIIYVRIKAKKARDLRPVTTQNPLSGVLQSQLENSEGGHNMVKSLASTFLSSETTVMEYDMREAKNMQGGVFFNMIFMWVLHFKMEQVQPLLLQVVSGFLQLLYSPLFQVYVLGRNLERPFKNQVSAMQKDKTNTTTADAGAKVDSGGTLDGDDEAASESDSQEVEEDEIDESKVDSSDSEAE